jgi:hypothetical protein
MFFLDSHLLTQYLLQRLLGGASDHTPYNRRLSDREAAEAKIFTEGGASVVYPSSVFSKNGRGSLEDASSPIRRYLDEAKEQIDVIDFSRPSRESFVRRSRQNPKSDEPLHFSDSGFRIPDSGAAPKSAKRIDKQEGTDGSASEQVPVKLAFPGNDFEPRQRKESTEIHGSSGSSGSGTSRWTMPLQRLGKKQYYLGIFFKANWYKAEQYCRFHGMHLCSIDTAEEQRDLQEHIQAVGMGQDHFWTSGTDQGEEGKFFWMSTGRPITYSNFNAGEPNNFEYEDGEMEHCLEIWDRDGKGLGWNDTPCSFQTYFICEV